MSAQAIETKIVSRGIKAFSEAFPRGVTVPYDYSLNSEDRHDTAARAFIKAKGWFGVWVRGGSPKGGFVYVCLNREVSGQHLKTPNPQACNFLDLLIVREDR